MVGDADPGATCPPQDVWSTLASLHCLFDRAFDCIPMGFSLRDPFLKRGRWHHTLKALCFFFFLLILEEDRWLFTRGMSGESIASRVDP